MQEREGPDGSFALFAFVTSSSAQPFSAAMSFRTAASWPFGSTFV
jgi:hypothetical protein